MDDIRAGIQYIFQTRSKLVLAMSGAGHAGMEAVITNLLGPNDTLLVASRGIWDERAQMIAKRQGIKVETTSVPMDSTFSFEQLEDALKKTHPQALFITHGHSSTGTVQKLEGLGALCHKLSTMSANLIVEPPVIKDRHVVKPLLCGPGPCDIWPSVAEAYQMPVLSHLCDEYFNVMDDIRAGIQYIFQTRSKLVLAMSGAGHAGMEAVITNLLGPNDTLLVASRGIWDERAQIMAKRQGIKVETTSVPMDSTFGFEQLEDALKKTRPQALFITHGDSSTGTVQKLQGLGALCHKYGALLLVDTVVSICAEPFFMDEWGVDGVYTSTQKALSGPAGISPVAFSERAQEKMNSRKHEPTFYLDIKLIATNWNCYGDTRGYHHTLSPPLLWALRACLKEVSKETLPVSWARHAASTAHFHKRLQDYKFQFLVPKPENRLSTVTTIVLPTGYDYSVFCKYLREKHNILIFRGLGPTVGKALRIGIMGVNSTVEVANTVVDAMVDAMVSLRKSSL